MNSGMKAKTIKSIIRKQIQRWLDSIEDREVRKACKEKTIVTGGCIASMLLGEDVNDFDLYFYDYDTVLKVANYYVTKFKEKNKNNDLKIVVEETKDLYGHPRIRIVVQSAGVESEQRDGHYDYFEDRPPEEAEDYVNDVFNDPVEVANQKEFLENKIKQQKPKGKFRPVFLSTNAITLSDKIQIVLRFFGDPSEIHKNYDFVHCTNYWTSWNNELVLNPKALECLLSKTLVYQGSLYPVCSIFRLRKFINRGWKINAGQMLKIMLQISPLDLTNYKVLEEQLTGVDVAYFEQVLKDVKVDNSEKIDSAYLVEIIDTMFGD